MGFGLKLTLKILEPYEFSSEIYCPPNLVPWEKTSETSFFPDFLMSEFSEEVYEFCNSEFYNELCNKLSAIQLPPKADCSLKEANEQFYQLALIEARQLAQNYRMVYVFSNDETGEQLFQDEFDLKPIFEEFVKNLVEDCNDNNGTIDTTI